jgi:hypothetical protein
VPGEPPGRRAECPRAVRAPVAQGRDLSAISAWHDGCLSLRKVRSFGAGGAGEEEDAMHLDLWYDLVVLEMAELSHPAREKLAEVEQGRCLSETAAEEPAAPAPA